MKSSHCLGIYRLLTRFPLENVLLHKSYMIRERSVVCVQNWWKWHSADLTHTNPNTTKVQRSIIRGMGHCEKCFAYIVYNTWLGVNCIWNDTDMMEWLFQPRILIRQFCLTKLETSKRGTESNFCGPHPFGSLSSSVVFLSRNLKTPKLVWFFFWQELWNCQVEMLGMRNKYLRLMRTA